jgi:diguanylate cyclase (GGDEF)-like protein
MSHKRMRDALEHSTAIAASLVVLCALIAGPASAQQTGPAIEIAEPAPTIDTVQPHRARPAPVRPVLPPRAEPPPHRRPAPTEDAAPRPGPPAPGALEGDTTSGPAAPPRLRRAPVQPVGRYAAGQVARGSGSPQSTPDATTSAPDEPAPRAAASGSGTADDRAKTQAEEKPSAEDPGVEASAGAEPERVMASPESDDPSPNMIERIVGVVPLPLKVALGILTVLLVLAIAGAWRTQRRLALAERRAATDVLTGLPNRRHADETLERLLASARRQGRSVAVVLFDLDHFKAINDRFGHAAGDDALRATAEATRELLRGGDYVARFGGEEFMAVLPETGRADASFVAESLRSRIEALDVPGLEDRMTASFGVAVYPDHGIGADELIKAADVALYRAKQAGRNRVESSTQRLLRVA